MGCGCSSKVESPRANTEPLPTILQSQSPLAQVVEKSKVPEPAWKARHYNRQIALQNLAVLAQSIAELEKLQPPNYDSQDILIAVNPVFHHFYGTINTGIECPFMSAEEVVEYFKLAGALYPRWTSRTLETVGGASQIKSLCEIFEFLDDRMVPIDECDIVFHGGSVRDLVNAFREISFPRWLTASMFQGDTAAKACLVTGRKWGLQETDAYQVALERLIRNVEGDMNCRYDDDNNCRIIGKACRRTHLASDIVRIDFHFTGHSNKQNPSASVIGWETDDGTVTTRAVTQIQISESTDTSIVGSMEFHNVPMNVPDMELWFRFSGDGPLGDGDCYCRTYLNFDHPDAKRLPNYWNRSSLFPKLANAGCGLSLRKSENYYRFALGVEHQSEIKDNYLAYNMFCTQGLQQAELSDFQKLFDASFRKKYTRDRKDGGVPDRLLITRGHRCQNVQNWIEYSRRRWQIKEELHAKKDLPIRIDNLKTASVLPEQDQYRLDSDAHEEFLFHGTNDTAADSITKGDFLVNLAGSNAGTLYGRGVYLAESVSKSDEYTQPNPRGERCILVCRATLGYVNYNDQIAPNVDTLVKSCTEGPYHCVLGDREKCRGTYREIMVYDGHQVYPEYVIWYKRVFEDTDTDTDMRVDTHNIR